MTTIADLEQVRRRRNGDRYLAALRTVPLDRAELGRIVAQHRAETAAAKGPSLSEVRVIARTHGPAEGAEPA